MTAPARLPGCTCVHAAHLHAVGGDRGRTGCIIGRSGAGEPSSWAGGARYYPASCPCTAAPVPLGHVVPAVLAAATETA